MIDEYKPGQVEKWWGQVVDNGKRYRILRPGHKIPDAGHPLPIGTTDSELLDFSSQGVDWKLIKEKKIETNNPSQ